MFFDYLLCFLGIIRGENVTDNFLVQCKTRTGVNYSTCAYLRINSKWAAEPRLGCEMKGRARERTRERELQLWYLGAGGPQVHTAPPCNRTQIESSLKGSEMERDWRIWREGRRQRDREKGTEIGKEGKKKNKEWWKGGWVLWLHSLSFSLSLYLSLSLSFTNSLSTPGQFLVLVQI